MIKIKKLLTTIIATSLLLVGCSTKETPKDEQKKEDNYSSTTLVREDNAIQSELVFYYENNDVKIQTAKNTVKYAALGKSKEEIEKALTQASNGYQNLKGVKHNLNFGDTEATEELYIDYDEADIKEIRKLTGSTFYGDENATRVIYSDSIEVMKKAGFKVKSENKK